MALAPDDTAVVQRITKRIATTNPATYRAGGRALALQAIEHRGDLVRALRGQLAELGERDLDERHRGYCDALEDVLLAAEAALEPREQELQARHALSSTPLFRELLGQIARAPMTPSAAAKAIGKSAPMGTRYFSELRALGLITELSSASGRERPHRITTLGSRLADVATAKTMEPAIPLHRPRVATAPPGSPPRLDLLTGVHLFDSFKQVLSSQLAVYQKARDPLSVMRVDIANFRELVASVDFSAVDACVVQVATTLKRELPALATIARYEPDKFVILLPQLPSAQAGALAATLLPKLSPVSAHIGIAGLDAAKHVDSELLLEGSDAALQEAKATARRWVTWAPQAPAVAARRRRATPRD